MMDIKSMISIPESKPNLQPKLKETREMMKYAAIFFLVGAAIWALWGLWSIMAGLIWSATWYGQYYGTGMIAWGFIRLVFAGVALVIKGKFTEDVIKPIDEGRYADLESKMILYGILGLLFGLVLSGILIFIGYMKFQESESAVGTENCPSCSSSVRFIPEYNRWYCDNCMDYKEPVQASIRPTTPPPPPPANH